MIKPVISISEVKERIALLKDKPVNVKVSLGRNKEERFCGVLTDIYPSLFTVRPDKKDYKGKTSYSYAEYLCGRVKLKEIK